MTKVETLSPETHVVVELGYVKRDDGWYLWMTGHDEVGPFQTPDACERALADLMNMTRSLGAIDVPLGPKN